MIPKLVIFYYF